MRRPSRGSLAVVVAPFIVGAAVVAARPIELQTPVETPLPKFDVASVRQNTLEGPSNNWQFTPGRINYQRSQVWQLIRSAWGSLTPRIEGGPGWITSERYDVVVQFPVDTPASTVNLMLRELLVDRFRLQAHVEIRELPVYEMTLARRDRRLGPNVTAGDPECLPPFTGRTAAPPQCGGGIGRGLLQTGSVDMPGLAALLSELQVAGRPVVDKTELAGRYKIDLTFAPMASGPGTPDGQVPSVAPDLPSIFTAMREQLGLKLDSARREVPVLVIDQVERPKAD